MNLRFSRIVPVLLAAFIASGTFADAAHPAHEASGHDHHDEHVDEVKLSPEAIERSNIRIGIVTSTQLNPTITAPARVAFNMEAMAHVGSVVKGRAIEIAARVGDTVKKGDALLVVESPELGEAQSDFLQKCTAVSVAQSAIEPAKSAADRAKALYEQSKGIALGELQKRVAEQKAAEGALKTAQAALTAAENKLHLMGMDAKAIASLAKSGEIDPRFTIRAPLGGQVIEREITLGELVAPEKDALLVLANMQTLWVVADVPEAQLRQVAVGAPARVRVGAVPDEALDGKVALISPALDPATRTAQVRIEVANGHNLRPGMFATAEIAAASSTTKPARDVLAIPDEAVQSIEGGPAVFVPVEGEPNTFAKRSITVGKAIGGKVPVLSGLKEGEKLVVSGSFILKAELGKGEAEHEH
jgi:cobalt-zinc-cadmium efflux system membrane fusion protein